MSEEERTSPPIRIRPAALAWTDVEDRIIALDIDASEYVELNPTAATILRALEGGASEEDLVTALEQEFEVDHQIACVGVGDFLQICRERGWLSE